MAEQMHIDPSKVKRSSPMLMEFGGLQVDVHFTEVPGDAGATMAVLARVGGKWTPILRFDDFAVTPHYHAPASAGQIDFDRRRGEPLDWYIAQLRDHLAEWVSKAGFAELLPSIDERTVTRYAETVRQAMIGCVPAGYGRGKGVGLQSVDPKGKALAGRS